MEEKYRKRFSGKYEIPYDFLHRPNYLHVRSVAGVDSNIFSKWALEFTTETEYLPRDGRNFLLIMDGYSCYIALKTLQLLCDNCIIVAGLPAHTSNVLQLSDVSVFSPLKEEFSRLLSLRTRTTTYDDRNDVFTICELLCDAYNVCVNAHNAIVGFRRTGLWSDHLQGVDIESILAKDFTFGSVSKECTQSISNVPSTMSMTAFINSTQSN